MTATPSSTLFAGAGLGTVFQAVPFQRATTARPLTVEPASPTTQALRAEAAATPMRLRLAPGFGLATRFQVVPFQCRMTGLPLREGPTAQALVAEVAATP